MGRVTYKGNSAKSKMKQPSDMLTPIFKLRSNALPVGSRRHSNLSKETIPTSTSMTQILALTLEVCNRAHKLLCHRNSFSYSRIYLHCLQQLKHFSIGEKLFHHDHCNLLILINILLEISSIFI